MLEIPYGSQSTKAYTGILHSSESLRMKRRVARVGTPAIDTRMQFEVSQNLWLCSRWKTPPVSITSTNLAFVSKERCSTVEGIE